MSQFNIKEQKEIAILNCYLFPFRKDELNAILSFIDKGMVSLHVMEVLFFENKDINGFYPLEFAKSFNELHKKIIEKVVCLSEAKSMQDVNMVMGSVNFILKTSTNIRAKFPDIVDYLRKDNPNLSDEDKNVKMEISNAIVIQENINDEFQGFIGTQNQKPTSLLSHIFQTKKDKELSNVNLFKAWEIVSQYIEGKPIVSNDINLQKQIKTIFNQSDMKKISISDLSEIKRRLFSGLDTIEKTIFNNSLETSLDVKAGLTNKKLKL